MKFFKLNNLIVVFIWLCLYTNLIKSQTTLTPGDIVVIGFKTNASTDPGNDCIKLLTLVDLECNTKFIVTDNNWNNSTLSWACNNDEAAVEISCSTAITQGSVFYIMYSAAGDPANCSGGTITKTSLGSLWGTNFGLSANGDNIYVLQGTRAAPVFIYALKHTSAFSNATCIDKDQAGLPSSLALGSSAIAISSSQDQWHYDCVTNTGTKAILKSAVSTVANWVNTSGQSWDNTSGFFSLTSPGFSYGVLAVSGSGCGCISTCKLAYSGSTNCTGVTGDCTIGYQTMSKNIVVPSGCTYSVTAEMKNRNYGCGSSGADGNCQGCDNVKVDILAGPKSFQQGASNTSLIDSYSASGPATIVVSGSANRADEIITYGIKVTPCNCVTIVLPIELTKFNAALENKSVNVSWATTSEQKNDFFTIERSENAINWEIISLVSGMGNTYSTTNYSIFDSSPLQGLSYYRLKQTDKNSKYSYSSIVLVNINNEEALVIKKINIYGQNVNDDATGITILLYNNGTAKKILK